MCLFLGLLAASLYVTPALATPSADVSMASSINVTTTDDVVSNTDGFCSLREALRHQNECGSGDTIVLWPTTFMVTNTAYGPLDVLSGTSLTITVADGGHAVIQGGSEWSNGVILINPNSAVTISDVTIQGGHASPNGGGISNAGRLSILNSQILSNTATSSGGGIYNTGLLTVLNSQIAGNAADLGGGIGNAGGATLWITGTTIFSNTSSTTYLKQGGGIHNAGRLSLYNSAVVSNTAENEGGGIFGDDTSGQIVLVNVTLSGNRAAGDGGGLYGGNQSDLSFTTIYGNVGSDGGGICPGAIANISGTIVFGNFPISNTVCSRPITSRGYNLLQSSGGVITSTTDLIGNDPLLEPLQDNGGPTPTHALRSNPLSPAINRVPSGEGGCGVAVTVDQRGFVSRPQGSGCDIGAFELENDLWPMAYLPLIER